MTTIERIKQLCDNEGITITNLEKKILASKGVLSRALNKKTDIQSKWLSIIVDNYPLYSARWLLTGNCKMLNKVPNNDINNVTIKWFQNKLDEKDIKIEELNMEIKDLLKANDMIQKKKTA